MNIKLSKSKKIILLITTLGILTTSIVMPIVILNSNKSESNEDKVREIISKIKDKDILIAPNVLTQNQREIQEAIKNQLQKENQTLTLNDLLKITTTLSSLTLGNRVEVTLIIKVNSASQNLKIHVEKTNLLKNSNINDGVNGTIFQDSFGNLWAMGNRTKLQVLKVNSDKNGYESTWTNNEDAEGLLKNSNIRNGYFGTIFQDFFGNLWAMGNKTKLQILKANSDKSGYASAWVNNNTIQGFLKNSNINNGTSGTIFQDSFKNLWTMGYGIKLQVLKVNNSKNGYVSAWINDENTLGLLNGSNIFNGATGTIFQDSFKNLWAMGKGTKLQVLKVNLNKTGYVNEGWTNNVSQRLLNNSNITNGYGGQIFQDLFKNLWSMGNNKKFQVLKVNSDESDYVNEGWINDATQGLLNNSNITDGYEGIIFQDSFGNLWAMGLNKKLQVLKLSVSKKSYVISWQN